MVNKILNEQQLKAVCDVVAETDKGYTKKELTGLLNDSKIEVVSDGKTSNMYGYTLGLNKREWLYKCLVTEINKNHSLNLIYVFFFFLDGLSSGKKTMLIYSIRHFG